MTRARLLGLLALYVFCGTAAACGQEVKSPPAAPKTAAGPAASFPRELVGRWKSTTDKLSEVEITPTRYIEKYAGKQVSASGYTISTTCGCADQKPLVYKTPVLLTVRSPQDGDCYCYIITKLTSNTLQLSNYGQGGGFSFVRVR
ncbi:hypothetical protein [Hymenobacter ruricola]|uniref:Lipoprotein n=1 Tax=Hymenobacter ruricola TaxID=2791023 RepID=A0ABS0HYP2_9BACT|nr:hypothetical protein [Hymenobacter ruricola]MBF9219800.1 hypothetical protein [Hymenobacter ruricola]